MSKDFQNGFALGMASGGIVEVPAKEEQEKTITITENGTTEILPDENKALSKVTVVTDVSGGGASLNIAYGETAPEDTSKLWIKANEPNSLVFKRDIDGVESISLCDDYLPTACYAMGCARVGKKIYLFGGYDTVAQDVVHVFDTETETITPLGRILPEGLNSMGCANVGTKIYVFGGISSSAKNTIYEFDTETKDIKTLSVKLPQNLSGMSCARVGNKIYLFGGHNGDKYVNTIVVFNTETKSITTSSVTLPDTTRAMGCAVVGTKIYLFGGRDDVITDTIKVFDTESETITTLETTLPEKNIYNIICATIGTKIYLFGGYLSGVGSKDTIAVFDTETEEISTLDTKMFTGAYGFGCASMGKDIYLFGGLGSSRLNTISRFTLTYELSQGNIEIEKDFFNNKFNLINTDNAQVEIGVENIYIGNENNEAEPVDAYLHNGTEWVQI
jgi:N-acetylneuraminic acid mutarotase